MNERLGPARAAGVDRLREVVLANAGLAEDQDADVVVENFPDRLEDIPQRGIPRTKEIPEARLTKSF